MTRPFSPDLRHALAQTKRLAYGEIKSGEALSAWKAFKDRWAYLRREHGMLVIEAFSLTQAFSMIAATWPAANPANKARRAREEANLSAMIKACLALIEGPLTPMRSKGIPVVWAAQAKQSTSKAVRRVSVPNWPMNRGCFDGGADRQSGCGGA
jgi:hypothetical protein